MDFRKEYNLKERDYYLPIYGKLLFGKMKVGYWCILVGIFSTIVMSLSILDEVNLNFFLAFIIFFILPFPFPLIYSLQKNSTNYYVDKGNGGLLRVVRVKENTLNFIRPDKKSVVDLSSVNYIYEFLGYLYIYLENGDYMVIPLRVMSSEELKYIKSPEGKS